MESAMDRQATTDGGDEGESSRRKAEHIELARTSAVEVGAPCVWDDVYLLHDALPELDRDEIRLDIDFLGHRLLAPLVIASMTGGAEHATTINTRLARLAERFGLAMGLGSGRVMLEEPAQERSFRVAREAAPTAFLFANIGAPQLVAQRGRPGYPPERLLRLVEVIGRRRWRSTSTSCRKPSSRRVPRARRAGGDRRAGGGVARAGDRQEIGCGIGRRPTAALARAGGGDRCRGSAPLAVIERRGRGTRQAAGAWRTFAGWGIPTPVATGWIAGGAAGDRDRWHSEWPGCRAGAGAGGDAGRRGPPADGGSVGE
jgi:isopentenyl-diphosphate delta-isomerase